MPRKRIFKDLFGKEIEVGQTVLNLWANDNDYPKRGEGGPGVIQFRISGVVKINPKSIRIEYMNSHKEMAQCNIYNTSNRILIMLGDNVLAPSPSEKIIKLKEQEIKSLEKDLLASRRVVGKADLAITTLKEVNNELGKINKELLKEIKEIEKDYKRFGIMEL